MEQEKTGETPRAERIGCFFCNTVRPTFQRMWSDATRGHFRNSRVEFLKGIRSLIDDRISSLSREPKTGQSVTIE